MIASPPEMETEALRSFRGGPGQEMSVRRHSFERYRTGGSGRGLAGIAVAIVNPTEATHGYRLQRRIGDGLIDDEVFELEARHQLVRVYRSATDEWIEVRVSGGPMVATAIRWDAVVESVW
jgi:hypothetical protein